MEWRTIHFFLFSFFLLFFFVSIPIVFTKRTVIRSIALVMIGGNIQNSERVISANNILLSRFGSLIKHHQSTFPPFYLVLIDASYFSLALGRQKKTQWCMQKPVLAMSFIIWPCSAKKCGELGSNIQCILTKYHHKVNNF